MPPTPTLDKLETIFTNLIRALLAVGAFALLLMLLMGGFKYLTSGGDEKTAMQAKNTLTYAIYGFLLLAGSYLILMIIGKITGTTTNITDFKIAK